MEETDDSAASVRYNGGVYVQCMRRHNMNHVDIIKASYLKNTDKKFFFLGCVCMCVSHYLSQRHLDISRDKPVGTGSHNCVATVMSFF